MEFGILHYIFQSTYETPDENIRYSKANYELKPQRKFSTDNFVEIEMNEMMLELVGWHEKIIQGWVRWLILTVINMNSQLNEQNKSLMALCKLGAIQDAYDAVCT